MESAVNYKCPCCGAPLRFDGKKQKLFCDSCSNEFETEAMEQFTSAEAEAQKESTFDFESYNGESMGDDAVIYACPSCGGEIMGDRNTVASKCPYCDNPVVLNENLKGGFKPDYIVPFVLSKKDAKKALTDYYKGKKLLPKCFSEENHLEDIQGIYVPFWVFDCDASGTMIYDATRVHHWSDRRYDYTRTDHYKLFRKANIAFDSIPVDGSTRMDDALMDSIEPFDYSKAVDFGTAFMPGFLADKYDVDADASRPRMTERVTNSTIQAMNSTVVGYTTAVPVVKSINSKVSNTKYAMMPVWLLNTMYKGKMYKFAVNGQTGKTVGNLPVDWGKFILRLLVGAGVALIPIALIALYAGGLL